jgi:hypothetical protein
MYKQTTVALILIIAISIPLQPLSAETHDSAEAGLVAQLVAIKNYLERILTHTATSPLGTTELTALIEGGSMWLTSAQEESGHFRYEYLPYEDEYLGGDNTVRQAGALYALGEIARRDPDLSHVHEETIERAIAFFESITVTEDRGEADFACVAEKEGSNRCVLGATSLALIGMLGYIEARPEVAETYEERIASYTDYILAAKKPGAGFRNVHRTDSSNQQDAESSFSNGEALLALVRSYKLYPRKDVKEVAADTFTYLSTTEYDTPLYLWMMAALKEMHTLWGNEEYVTYGKDYTDWRIARANPFRGTDRNYCAYAEGIASAYTLLEESATDAEKTALKTELDHWNRKHSTLQITEDDRYRILVDREEVRIDGLENPELAIGGFLTGEREPTQRIDFTQHCITTYVQTLVDIEGSEL